MDIKKILSQKRIIKSLKEANSKYKRIVENQKHLEDYSTSLYNKNFFLKNMDNISLQMIRGRLANKANGNDAKTWSLLFCDIDGLKLTNDTIGHLEADKGIQSIADILKGCIRCNREENDQIIHLNDDRNYNQNIPIRFGGDEFVIILPNCTKEKALLIENRIKCQIEINKDLTRNMTLSIGIADTNEIEMPKNIDNKIETRTFIDSLVTLAEKRMYNDKNKDIKNMSDEVKRTVLLKHLNRIADQIGFNINDTEDIDALINILSDLKDTKKEQRIR